MKRASGTISESDKPLQSQQATASALFDSRRVSEAAESLDLDPKLPAQQGSITRSINASDSEQLASVPERAAGPRDRHPNAAPEISSEDQRNSNADIDFESSQMQASAPSSSPSYHEDDSLSLNVLNRSARQPNPVNTSIDFIRSTPDSPVLDSYNSADVLAAAVNNQHNRYPEAEIGIALDTASLQQQPRWAGASHRFSQQVIDSPSSRMNEFMQGARNQQGSDASPQKQMHTPNKLSISMTRPQTPDNSNLPSHRPSDHAAHDSCTPSERTAYSHHQGAASATTIDDMQKTSASAGLRHVKAWYGFDCI